MGSGAWLRLLLSLAALWGLGARETLLATLGTPTLLRPPRELRELTEKFGEASWKRLSPEPQRKSFLLRISGWNFTEFEPGRLRFHRRDFSLEILNTSREDRRLYEFSASGGREEEVWQVQLEVFEPVGLPSIRVLRREFSNGSCRLSLRCSSERGDAVSYSWDSGDSAGDGGDSAGDSGDSAGDSGDSAGPCSGTGSLLNLSFSVPGAAFGCVCRARNAVSSREVAFDPRRCGAEGGGVPGLWAELPALPVALGLIPVILIIVTAVIVTCRARGEREQPQDSAGATIYSQVQKPKVPKATPASPCATVYAAATGPPLSPGVSPGVSLSQEPSTVYATVTLPPA